MDLRSAQLLARQLLDQHGLTRWRVELDSAVTRAGVCRYDERTIGLSAPLTRLHGDAEVRETILHEVAHALAGPRAKHGPRWRAIAHSIGSTGERCLDEAAPRIEGPWIGICPTGHRLTRHRRPTRVVTCGQCTRRFDLRHLLTWTHRGEPGVMHVNYTAELEALRTGTTPVVALPVGTPVRITVPGRYAGRSGHIVRRGRTRFHVRCGALVIEVPFAGVAPVVGAALHDGEDQW
ncbi:MAG: SprT-like domain-containing protein [Actinomycetota bacterium]|nr:SprT-like domain-containing protein [Actinomycetota bacterium]